MNEPQNTQDQPKKERPDWHLVQEKAYFTIGKDGSRVRKTKNVKLTAGWDRLSEKGREYISYATVLQSIEPDVDGRIKLICFVANNDENQA